MAAENDKSQNRTYNFSPGPAALPLAVLQRAQQELLCYPQAGASVLEISHRGAPFTAILESATRNLARLLDLPQNYRILFLQGGARLQFSMVPMNLLRGSGRSADYVLTGSWGKKAIGRSPQGGRPRGSFGTERSPATITYRMHPSCNGRQTPPTPTSPPTRRSRECSSPRSRDRATCRWSAMLLPISSAQTDRHSEVWPALCLCPEERRTRRRDDRRSFARICWNEATTLCPVI